MSFIVKSTRFIYGLLLLGLNLRVLNILNLLKDKRIAIVGPASSAFNTEMGEYIDGFDIIIRVNKSAIIVGGGKYKRDIGSRTDILFHSFFENEISGGGPLNMELYDGQGIKYLISPRNTWAGLRNTFNFYKKYCQGKRTFTLPKSLYKRVSIPLIPYKPTIGLTAILTAMQAEFKELYITGFTFYKTPFGSGYRDQIQDAEKAKSFINEQGIHNIDLEFSVFKDCLHACKHKRIVLDSVLESILLSEE
jgi:hypothetical protein